MEAVCFSETSLAVCKSTVIVVINNDSHLNNISLLNIIQNKFSPESHSYNKINLVSFKFRTQTRMCEY